MCIKVSIPGKPFDICMQCDNPLPAHATYVYTPTWIRDKRCDWICESGWDGTLCDHTGQQNFNDIAIFISFGFYLFAIMAFLILYVHCMPSQKPKAVVDPLECVVVHKTTMVQFRDPMVSSHQLRIKLQ